MSVTNAKTFFSFENTINQLIITITLKMVLNIQIDDFLTDDINVKDFLSFFFLSIFFRVITNPSTIKIILLIHVLLALQSHILCNT